MRRLAFLAVLPFVASCADVGPTEVIDTLSPHRAGQEPLAYSGSADCRASTLIDPGTERQVGDLTIITGRIFDCAGVPGFDVVGPVRVIWRRAVFGPIPGNGRITGKTIWTVENYFGRTDLEGAFVGPFDGTLDEIVAGTLPVMRRGTGDFRGLFMKGEFFQDPPGSQITFENGVVIHRNARPPRKRARRGWR